MKIVLLGSLPKGDEVRRDWIDWKVEFSKVISKVLPEAEFIHGDSISDNAGAELVVGHDLYQIQQADMCVIDSRTKLGAGTAQEMVFAKYLRKPVVTILPKDSHHRKSNVVFHGVRMEDWVHPFIKLSSDYIAESIEGATAWIKSYSESSADYAIKDLTVFEKAIEKYASTLDE